MMRIVILGAAVATVLTAGGVAQAYPQFQMSRDQTCTGCHISPSGGGLLNENGLNVAEAISQLGTAPEFMYGKLGTPDWLVLGGDARGAAGYFKYGGPKDTALYAFPMQIDTYARATFGSISLQVDLGFRPAQEEHKDVVTMGPLQKRAITYLWSREHYITWRQNPDENSGLYIRAGRFMPVFGLRFAEHPMYTRRFGGTQLYTDTYGVAAEFIDPKWEIHATGFIDDPVVDPVEHANGGAVYGEIRATEKLSFGAGFMFKAFTDGKFLFSASDEMNEYRADLTAKLYIAPADVLLQGEFQFVNDVLPKINRSPDSMVGGAPKGVVGALVASRMITDWLLLDVGFGYYSENVRVPDVDRECVDLNLHWFTTSHVELILNSRYEMIGFGNGNDPGSYVMLQGHYRL